MKILESRRNFSSSEGTTEISQPQSGWRFSQNVFRVPQGRRTVFQPLRGRLTSGCRSATRFALAALIPFLAVGAMAAVANGLPDAEIKGRELAQQLCDARPDANFTQSGILKIRAKDGNTTNIYVSFQTLVTPKDWQTTYRARHASNSIPFASLQVLHRIGQPNRYAFSEEKGGLANTRPVLTTILKGNQTMIPFAGSDFWIADLGLEFFHWPEQKILPNPTNLKRGRSYTLLESTNPNPSTNGYSRVLSWIDKETGGILEAEAYDAQGRLLKEFEPKSFKKVNGQWELQEMEIDNVQTGSRTRLEFDLKK
jgi:hypothetical protein